MTIRLTALFGLAVLLACARTTTVVYAPEPVATETVVEVEHQLASEPDWSDLDLEARLDLPVRDVVYTDPGELPQLLHAGVALPLRNTDVRAHLRGVVAEVVVTQRFVNSNPVALDAVYTFPLPENSAVTDMRMVVGARTIVAEVRERGQARAEFSAARAEGHTAALLEQERPNVFTQSLANIPPGETVDVELRYLQTLSYDAGEYEFVFPTVVGPRYVPGAPLAGRSTGTGTAADTDRVPDGSRISPPTLGRGVRTGNDLSIEVVAEATGPITAWAALAHDVVATPGDRGLHVALARHDEIPNRDFVLRYRSAGAQPTAKLFLGPASPQGGHFLLVVDPPRLDVDDLVGRRELLFVVDISGSMNGPPLALAKAAMREALARARPVDTFDVITFASGTGRLFGVPRPASADNLRQAIEFIDGLGAGGGTEMSAAVGAALRDPVEDGRHRYVFLMTDGFIGDEAEIAAGAASLVAAQRREGRRARVFSVGIGDAPNSHLLDVLARAGDGTTLSVRRPADLARSGRLIERTIDSPVLTDVAVEWGSLRVHDLSVAPPPDLLASHPLVVHGRFTGAVPSELRLRGRVGARSVTVPIEVVAAGESDQTLARLWARDRIGDLDLALATTSSASHSQLRGEILHLGLQHHLVTQFTSLIAVDRTRRVDGPALEVVQPVELASGVDPDSYSGGRVTRVDMSRVRNIPVGGASRDFTAVVDMAPTASRDSGGIRLGGSTGIEQEYVSESVERFDSIYYSVRPELGLDPVPSPARGFVRLDPHATTRVRRITGAGAAASERLRRLLGADAEPLARCFVDAGPPTFRVHRRLVVTVRLTQAGALARMDVTDREPLPPALAACLRQQIAPHVRGAVGPGATVEIELGVWMRF